jgi:hypothetical protein
MNSFLTVTVHQVVVHFEQLYVIISVSAFKPDLADSHADFLLCYFDLCFLYRS